MIQKLRYVDPRGVACLNQLVLAPSNRMQYSSGMPDPDDCRVIIPVEKCDQVIKILSVKAEQEGDGVGMEVTIEIADGFWLYEFSEEMIKIKASRPQQKYRCVFFPVSRAVVNAVLSCLAVFPDGETDPGYFWQRPKVKDWLGFTDSLDLVAEMKELADFGVALCKDQ